RDGRRRPGSRRQPDPEAAEADAARPGPDAAPHDQPRPARPAARTDRTAVRRFATLDGMHLDVGGAGPAYTDRLGASGASYLLRADGTNLLLDLGQGSFPRLASLLPPETLDAIVVSHLHPDHFVDLVALRHYLRFEREPARVRVIG